MNWKLGRFLFYGLLVTALSIHGAESGVVVYKIDTFEKSASLLLVDQEVRVAIPAHRRKGRRQITLRRTPNSILGQESNSLLDIAGTLKLPMEFEAVVDFERHLADFALLKPQSSDQNPLPLLASLATPPLESPLKAKFIASYFMPAEATAGDAIRWNRINGFSQQRHPPRALSFGSLMELPLEQSY